MPQGTLYGNWPPRYEVPGKPEKREFYPIPYPAIWDRRDPSERKAHAKKCAAIDKENAELRAAHEKEERERREAWDKKEEKARALWNSDKKHVRENYPELLRWMEYMGWIPPGSSDLAEQMAAIANERSE